MNCLFVLYLDMNKIGWVILAAHVIFEIPVFIKLADQKVSITHIQVDRQVFILEINLIEEHVDT